MLDLAKIIDQVRKDAKSGKKRSFKKSAIQALKNLGIQHSAVYSGKYNGDIPTIIISNHFVRPILLRGSLYTTLDSFITSAIVVKTLNKFSRRDMTVIVKNDLSENIFFLSTKLRKIQLSAIEVFDFVGVSKNYPFGEEEKWYQALKSGKNILVYPEGIVSQSMKKQKPGFAKVIRYLLKKGLDFQVLPVGIHYIDSQFKIKYGSLIQPQLVLKNEEIASTSIAANLPSQFRGQYKIQAKEYIRSQARQQPADGRKRLFVEPQVLEA